MTIPNDANTYLPGVIAIPSSLKITAMSNSYPMVVSVSVNTVTEANTYIAGQVVKLNVPIIYGMYQANGLTPQVLSNNNNDLTLDVDSTHFDVFTLASSSVNAVEPATLSPFGSRNLTIDNTTTFASFQSLNNRGN